MTAIIGAVVQALFWGLKLWMKGKQQDEEFYKSFLTFLEIANKKGYVKVANLQAGEDSLERLKQRVKKRHEQKQREQQKQ